MDSQYGLTEKHSKPKIRAFLRPPGKAPVPLRNTSSSNVSKSVSNETKDSEGTNSNDSQQPKENSNHLNSDVRSLGFRDPFTTTTESLRSVDSERSLNTVFSTNTPKAKSSRLSVSKLQSQLPKNNSESTKHVATRRGSINQTFENQDKKETVFPSPQKVRNVNRQLELTKPLRTSQRTGLQLYKTEGADLDPFKTTKITLTKIEEPESTYSERSEIVGGCRIITTRPDNYSSTLKAIHPSSKIYQTIPEMDPQAKEELLADFAKAGIDLEKLGENFEDIGIKMSHDPIMHRFKEIPVFRRKEERISQLMTSQFMHRHVAS